MQRRGGLLSPVPDVGQEQEQSHAPYRYNETMPLPTTLPPAPSVQPAYSPQSRVYRALQPGMGAVPAAHDLPTQFPARPAATAYGSSSSWGRQSNGNIQQVPMHTPARPFAVPVAGPLPAADFSFGAPEPGHGDAFTRAMGQEGMDVETSPVNASPPNGEFNQPSGDYSQSNGEFSQSNGEFNQSSGEFAAPNSNNTGEYNTNSGEYNSNEYTATEFSPPMWDARTRFGSMASIASDVTGVSVSSTQATSVSGGLGTSGFGNGVDCEGAFGNSNGFGDARGFNGDARGFGHGYTLSAGYPSGFQPDLRRASCPGEFLHQFSGMGVNGNGSGSNTNEGGARSTSLTQLRPSMLGRSLTLAADAQLPSPNSNQHQHQAQNSNQHHNSNSNPNQHGLTISSEGHRGVNLALEAKTLRSPTFPPGQVDPTYPPPPPGLSVGAGGGPFAPREPESSSQQQQHVGHSMGQHMNQHNQHMNQSTQHMNQANLSPAQRALVGGGFGSEPTYSMNLSGYDANTGFETHTPPSFETSPNMGGGVDGMGVGVVDGMNMGGVGMTVHGSSGKGSPMLFTGVGVEGEPVFGMNTMSPDSLAMAMIGQEYGMPGGFSFPSAGM